ncbi:hypothetical protein FNU76_05620 [Chitinimonas arctica]|uniref:Uncharacterized protein n=1 Tax=Chitinimonas arctica TaxID=2594795 RepID=A0A516SCI7_9NEIS|nr:DUF4136 domain-containing protein [Chitinimonas arctica]QDQ25869.1 hypothetical protein FNU76_05620 [Chitinimonas arctica]
MVAQLHLQLTQSLASADVSLKVIRLKDSEAGRSFAFAHSGSSIESSFAIRRTIESNLLEERTHGTDYRLIIFPSSIELSDRWKRYTINWDLIDVKTGRRVWNSSSVGRHWTMLSIDEDPEVRAKIIVDGAIAEFKRSGLI